MSKIDYEVSPTNRAALMGLADSIRTFLRIETPFFPILQVVEVVLPRIAGMEDLVLTIGDMAEMGDDHGLTFTDRKEIRLREDVYEGSFTLTSSTSSKPAPPGMKWVYCRYRRVKGSQDRYLDAHEYGY